MSSAQFYYYKNRGQTLGPFDLGQIQQRAKRAQISNRSEISTDGFSWQPAQNFPEIFAGSTAAPPSAATPATEEAVAVVWLDSRWISCPGALLRWRAPSGEPPGAAPCLYALEQAERKEADRMGALRDGGDDSCGDRGGAGVASEHRPLTHLERSKGDP